MEFNRDRDYERSLTHLVAPEPQLADVAEPRFRLLTIEEVEAIPAVTFLVDQIIPTAGAGELHAPPGGGKTFLALDLALCVASGVNFFGHKVQKGNVIYVLGEGQSGAGARIRAWKARRQVWSDIRFHLVPEPVQLLDQGDVALFLHALGPLPESPSLIVLDTLARSFLGGEENSAKDMGQLVARVDYIRKRTGAAVLLVHHTRVDEERERGSIALRGGMDTMLALKAEDDQIKLVCEKQKDAREFAAITLQLVPSADSMVFAEPGVGQRAGPSRKALGVLEVLARDFPGQDPTTTEWKDAASVPHATFYRARGALLNAGYVAEEKKGNAVRYRATPEGKAAIVMAGRENGSTYHEVSRGIIADLIPTAGSLSRRGERGETPPVRGAFPTPPLDEARTAHSEKAVVGDLEVSSGLMVPPEYHPDEGDLAEFLAERDALLNETGNDD